LKMKIRCIDGERYRNAFLAGADAPGTAEELAADLEEACGRAPEYVMKISPVVGINTGPGSAGFALILED
jgi:fatty acid-binding protein DegV